MSASPEKGGTDSGIRSIRRSGSRRRETADGKRGGVDHDGGELLLMLRRRPTRRERRHPPTTERETALWTARKLSEEKRQSQREKLAWMDGRARAKHGAEAAIERASGAVWTRLRTGSLDGMGAPTASYPISCQ